MLANYYPKQMPMVDEELEEILKGQSTIDNKGFEKIGKATAEGVLAGSVQPAQRQPLALEARALSDLHYTLEQELATSKRLFTENILDAAKNGRRGIKITMLIKDEKINEMRLNNEKKILQWLKDEGFAVNIDAHIKNVWEVTW